MSPVAHKACCASLRLGYRVYRNLLFYRGEWTDLWAVCLPSLSVYVFVLQCWPVSGGQYSTACLWRSVTQCRSWRNVKVRQCVQTCWSAGVSTDTSRQRCLSRHDSVWGLSKQFVLGLSVWVEAWENALHCETLTFSTVWFWNYRFSCTDVFPFLHASLSGCHYNCGYLKK